MPNNFPRRVIIVHGFNVSDGGAGTTGQLIPELESRGCEIINFTTDWKPGIIRDLFTVRFCNAERAEQLAELIQPGDLLIGHSNGCALIRRALKQLSSLDRRLQVKVVYFNPALNKTAAFSPCIEKALVFYAPDDSTVWWSRVLRWHEWGEAGRTGFKNPPERVTQLSYPSALGLLGLGHSGIFHKKERVTKAIQAIEDWLQEH